MKLREGIMFACRGGSLKLGPEALATLWAHRQIRCWHRESGGVLLGRRILDSADVVIDLVTTPQASDRRTRCAFHRSHEPHQQEIESAWQRSEGTCQYLGEWHTHPEAVPTPSHTDLSDWRRRLRTDIFEGDGLFFVIVGTKAIVAWEGVRSMETLRSLELRAFPVSSKSIGSIGEPHVRD